MIKERYFLNVSVPRWASASFSDGGPDGNITHALTVSDRIWPDLSIVLKGHCAPQIDVMNFPHIEKTRGACKGGGPENGTDALNLQRSLNT